MMTPEEATKVMLESMEEIKKSISSKSDIVTNALEPAVMSLLNEDATRKEVTDHVTETLIAYESYVAYLLTIIDTVFSTLKLATDIQNGKIDTDTAMDILNKRTLN